MAAASWTSESGWRQLAYAPLWQEAEAGATLLTPHAYAARRLRRAWGQYQAGRGKRVWEMPVILSWDEWLESLWSERRSSRGPAGTERSPLRLSPYASRILWREALAFSGIESPGMDELASGAWKLIHDYCLRPERGEGFPGWAKLAETFDPAGESQAFFTAARHYEKRIQDSGACDEAQFAGEVEARLQQDPPQLPTRVVLLHFDEITPRQQWLLQRLRRAGCESRLWAPEAFGKLSQTAADDPETEAWQAAAWTRDFLARNPAAELAIVTPDIQAYRSLFMEALTGMLAPEQWLTPAETRQRPFALAQPLPLSDYEIIQAALCGLRYLQVEISFADASRGLRSPYLGSEEEMRGRHKLERRLREETAELRRGDWQSLALGGQQWAGLCPAWGRRSRQLAELDTRPASPSRWRERLHTTLDILGWPGTRGLNSDEYQITEAWGKLLTEFNPLDRVTRPWSLEEAIGAVEEMAAGTFFQPAAPAGGVQILSAAQMAGCYFDGVYGVGWHDQAWPPPAQPHPLLPFRLQQEFGLPRATPQSARHSGALMLGRIFRGAAEVVMSYPQQQDNTPRGPCPGLPEEIDRESHRVNDWRRQMPGAELEPIPKLAAPARPGKRQGAGAGLLRAQAECSFRALALYRLGAEEWQTPDLGWDAMRQGILAHAALKILWETLKNSGELQRRLAAGGLELLIEQALKEAREKTPLPPHPLVQSLADLEVERWKPQLVRWLQEVEAARAPFRVAQAETKMDVNIAGLEMTLRLDRVDEQPDGRRLIVDYKTGGAIPLTSWTGARPDEPQLPLYAAFSPAQPDGMAFALIRPDLNDFSGASPGTGWPDGIDHQIKNGRNKKDWTNLDKAGWPRQLAEWKAVFIQLAEEFLQGRGEINPKKHELTCDRCHLHMLCRIREIGYGRQIDPDDAGSAEDET